ncbi:MAG: winged helix-turn-helix domain-containing protein, partial [Bacillota bacterium]
MTIDAFLGICYNCGITTMQEMTMQKEDLTKNFVKTIKQRILNGEYKAGDNFPPLRKLAEDFNCSRSVINVGIARLEAQGYLAIQKRQKTVVKDFINRASL